MNEIKWTLNLLVTEGPKFPFTEVLNVEAYDKVSVWVPGQEDVKVSVQPGEKDEIELVLITISKKPEVENFHLYYTVNEEPEEVALWSLHMVVGRGANGLLSQSPNTLTLINRNDEPAEVTVLIARKAVEPEVVAPVESRASKGSARRRSEDKSKEGTQAAASETSREAD